MIEQPSDNRHDQRGKFTHSLTVQLQVIDSRPHITDEMFATMVAKFVKEETMVQHVQPNHHLQECQEPQPGVGSQQQQKEECQEKDNQQDKEEGRSEETSSNSSCIVQAQGPTSPSEKISTSISKICLGPRVDGIENMEVDENDSNKDLSNVSKSLLFFLMCTCLYTFNSLRM